MESKQQILDEISELLMLPRWVVSNGSTEPKTALVAIVGVLGLQIAKDSSKTAIGRAIVEASGCVWLPRYESRGETITRAGLAAIRDAVRSLS